MEYSCTVNKEMRGEEFHGQLDDCRLLKKATSALNLLIVKMG
jgi:hypothetical protein